MTKFLSIVATNAVVALLVAPTVFGQAIPRIAPGLDGQFVELAAQLPGFGGYFFDDNGDLNVYLTDLSREAEARVLLMPVAASRPPRWYKPYAGPAQLVFHQGRFDFPTLDAIKVRVAAAVIDIPGVSRFDTDEARNQVFVGVTTEDARNSVLSRVDALGIASGAVSVEIVPVGHLLTTTLRDQVRPIVGGLQIDYTTSDMAAHQCTMGVNVWYSNPEHGVPAGTPGFYTAAHCSQTQNQTDGTVYSQGGAYVGTEMYDPMPFYPSQNQACLEGWPACRWSDVTFVATDASVNRAQGYLAQTTFKGVGPGSNNSGSITLDTTSTWQFTITATVAPVQGITLDKVGRTTGWTEGGLGRTCVDQLINNTVILCSYEVNAFAAFGDSGAPVFQLLGSNNVAFAGIAWFSTGSTFFYSDVNQIAKDMGTGVNYRTF